MTGIFEICRSAFMLRLLLNWSGFFYKDGGVVSLVFSWKNELQHSVALGPFGYPDQPIDYTVADYDVQKYQIWRIGTRTGYPES